MRCKFVNPDISPDWNNIAHDVAVVRVGTWRLKKKRAFKNSFLIAEWVYANCAKYHLSGNACNPTWKII